MSEITLRPATPADQWPIRWWVLRARLDPTKLHWSQFTIAEHDGERVGVGQIRPHPDGPELGSLIVHADWRGQGVGGLLIRHLVASVGGDVYLECEGGLTCYYARFGFEEIDPAAGPRALRRNSQLGNALLCFSPMRIAVMRYSAAGNATN